MVWAGWSGDVCCDRAGRIGGGCQRPGAEGWHWQLVHGRTPSSLRAFPPSDCCNRLPVCGAGPLPLLPAAAAPRPAHRMMLRPLPFQKARRPSSARILRAAWPTPVYAVAEVPADGTTWTCRAGAREGGGAHRVCVGCGWAMGCVGAPSGRTQALRCIGSARKGQAKRWKGRAWGAGMHELPTTGGRTWKSSLIRSRGAVAVRATAPAAPPATNILRVAPRTDGEGWQSALVHAIGSYRPAD